MGSRTLPSSMPKAAIGYGGFLLILGVGFYIVSGATAITALIPAFLAIPIIVLGFLARNERRRTSLIYGAFGLGIIGLLGGLMGVAELPRLLTGLEVERPLAVTQQLIMFLGSVVFVGLSQRSFRASRRHT